MTNNTAALTYHPTMSTVTVTIGRNVGSDPMSDARWLVFHSKVAWDVNAVASDVFVKRAATVGVWQGVSEECLTWVFATTSAGVTEFIDRMSRRCYEFEQDAIAVTVGETTLVESAS